MRHGTLGTGAVLLAGGLLAATPGFAAGDMDSGKNEMRQSDRQAVQQNEQRSADSEKADAHEIVSESVSVVGQMKADPALAGRMKDAKGIFIVPDFGRAALIAGARGGGGVMLTHQDGTWSNPAFYNYGAISVGAQAGATGGSVAMLLMSDEAVNRFKQQNNFSLNADAGISIVDWSANTQARTGGDVIVWSDTEGLFAGAEVSVSDISFDDDETRGFYGEKMSPQDVFASRKDEAAAKPLKSALPG